MLKCHVYQQYGPNSCESNFVLKACKLYIEYYLQNNFSSYGENKEDYSDLPPNQRKKKLQLRVEDITAKIQQETAAR